MKPLSITLISLVFILGVLAILKERYEDQLNYRPKFLKEKVSLETLLFWTNLFAIVLTFAFQLWDSHNTTVADEAKDKKNSKHELQMAKKDSLSQVNIIKNFRESLAKADSTLGKLKPILEDSRIQLSLQKENIDSAKRILNKNDSLITKQNATYKGMKLLLNPISPLNMTLQFRVSFKTGYTDSLEARLYKLRDKPYYSKYIKFSATKDTVDVPNMDSLRSLDVNSREEYDSFIKTVIIITKQPIQIFKSGFPPSMKGSVFVTGLVPELEEYFALRMEFVPFRRVIKTLDVDFKSREFIFQVKFYDLRGNEGSGNLMSNDISFDNLPGCNFLIATNNDYKQGIMRLERITVSSTYGTRKGFFMDFKKASFIDMDGKVMYYHKIDKKDFRPPNTEVDDF